MCEELEAYGQVIGRECNPSPYGSQHLTATSGVLLSAAYALPCTKELC